MIDSKEIEDMIAELEESVIILQNQPGQHIVVEQLQQQINTLKSKLNYD